MPKFRELEKLRIEQCLLIEGERLFSSYGLKKVTVDDIVQAVKIAKASFYKFYDGKEDLFLDILKKEQKELSEQVDNILFKMRTKSDKEKVKSVLLAMPELMKKYPLLMDVDKYTETVVFRKIGQENLSVVGFEKFDLAKILQSQGVNFKYDIEIVSLIFKSLICSWNELEEQNETLKSSVIEVMIDGIIEQIA